MIIKLLGVVGLVNMNKSDFKLILTLIIIISISFLSFKLFNQTGDKEALVYYSNKLVLTIPLSDLTYKEYNVKGKNGNILIIRDKGKIRVKQETSPLHLCSKQSWISNSNESIICLPNEVIIKIEATSSLDTVVQ